MTLKELYEQRDKTLPAHKGSIPWNMEMAEYSSARDLKDLLKMIDRADEDISEAHVHVFKAKMCEFTCGAEEKKYQKMIANKFINNNPDVWVMVM